MRFILATLAAMVLCACATPKPLTGQPTADSLYAAGTLAPIGSFEFEAAPTLTQITVMRHLAAIALEQHRITTEDAMRIQRRSDAARSLLDQALAACAEDYTGKCTGSIDHARTLLIRASYFLSQLQGDYPL